MNDFPPMPDPTWMMPTRLAGKFDIPGAFTAQQMRDYVEADRARRQAEPTDLAALLSEALTAYDTQAHWHPERWHERVRTALTQRQAVQEVCHSPTPESATQTNLSLTGATQAVQEPAAYGAQHSRTGKWMYIWHEHDDVKGWIHLQHQSRDDVTYHGPVPLYTAAPPPAQVPLTDAQIDAIMNPLTTMPYSWRAFARAIEAAHGIK